MDTKTKALFDAEVALIKRDLKKEIEKTKNEHYTLDERDLLQGLSYEEKIEDLKEGSDLNIEKLRAKLERESLISSAEIQEKEIEDRETEAKSKQDVGNILIKAIPKDKDSRLDEAWKIARRLVRDIYSDVDNFYFAQCLNRKVTRSRFPEMKSEYLPQILNRIRTIKKYWRPYRHTVSFSNLSSKVVKT